MFQTWRFDTKEVREPASRILGLCFYTLFDYSLYEKC